MDIIGVLWRNIMKRNNNLIQAKHQKDDEHYTMYTSIELELVHYEDQLRDKIIYCNCDDVEHSNFIEYLCRQGPYIGIKKLYGTCYKADNTSSYYITFEPPENLEEFESDNWKDYLIKTQMNGNGDFRSEESIELLKESDVIISNPPFSLYREYVAQLIEYDKKFLIIGNENSITYKEIFKLIKDNKLWYGYTKVKEFLRPDGSISKFGNVSWFTNLEVTKRNEPMILIKEYYGHEEEFLQYDNYNAIEVSKTCNIPRDYNGIMGVPISWLDKYCPNQFSILCLTQRDDPYRNKKYTIEDQNNASDLNRSACIIQNGVIKPMYARILIRRRQEEN